MNVRIDTAELGDVFEVHAELVTTKRVHEIEDQELVEILRDRASTEAIDYVLLRGYRALIKDRKHRKLQELKILQLEPDWFKNIEADATHYVNSQRQAEKLRREQIEKGEIQCSAAERRRIHEARIEEEAVAKVHQLCARMQVALSFYDSWQLSSGKKLGDATKEDLLKESAKNELTADGMLKNVTFYKLLADRLKDGEKVADKVPLEEAHRLREEVYVART